MKEEFKKVTKKASNTEILLKFLANSLTRNQGSVLTPELINGIYVMFKEEFEKMEESNEAD